MMFLSIIFVLVTSVATQDELGNCTTCVKLDDACYNISFLFPLNATFRNQVVIPKMRIRHSDNLLFYSFEPIFEDPEYYKVAYVNLESPDTEGEISDDHIKILNFGTFDIDQENDDVFLGGSDGIFKYDKYQKLSPFSSRGDTITSLFFKNNIYFVDYDAKIIKQKKNDQFHDILEADNKIKNFIITKYDVIVYLSEKGLFLKKKNETVPLTHYPFYRGMTMDLDGGVYVWWLDDIYKIIIETNLSKSRLMKIGKMKEPIGAMTFGNDNSIIFNVDRSLYRMKRVDTVVCQDFD